MFVINKIMLKKVAIYYYFILFVNIILLNLSYAAKITVSPLSLSLSDSGPGFADVIVYNSGDSKAYVKLDLYKIKNPGTKSEKKIIEDIKNPLDFGLVASPLKMIIPVNQSRRVRLLKLSTKLSQESVYKLEIIPVEGDLKLVGSSESGISAGVKVTVGYGVRVVLLPEKIDQNVILVRKKVKNNNYNYYLQNTGNVDVLISESEVCDKNNSLNKPEDWTNCKLLKTYSSRLYPGNSILVSGIKTKTNSKSVRFKGYFLDKLFYIS